jgi:hypothetical protein
MDDALVLASTTVGNTEDVLVVDSPPSGAHASNSNDNDVQIVGAPQAVAVEERPHKKSKSNNGNGKPQKEKKKQKRPPISDSDLEKQVNQVRDVSGGENIIDSSLNLTQLLDIDNKYDANKEIKEGTKYFTMTVSCGKSSPWWEGFEHFIPVKHPMLYKKHVLCKECSTFRNNPDAGIVKIGASQSTSNLRSHKKHHHPAKYKTITKGLNKITKKLNGEGVLPKSILNIPGFTAKVKVKGAKLLYKTSRLGLRLFGTWTDRQSAQYIIIAMFLHM